MREDDPNPQINVSKIAVSGGLAGALFTIGSMLILLTGIPILWFLFPTAVVFGGGLALILHFRRHKTTGASWILAATKK